MLDGVHKAALKWVADGDPDSSPAVENLLAAGLIRPREGAQGWELTPSGTVALERSKKTKAERRWWLLAATGGTVVGLVELGELLF